MAIKVQFPVGASDVTVRGLYQWDYGQTLEIECSEIGSEIVEVHFACANMAEAIVRTCTFSNGIGTVKIPDECLEQTSAVTAWICKVDSTQRHTIKTIVLPLTARTRPSNIRDIPTDYVDVYGQLIEEVNEAINALEKGNVTAEKAKAADTAGHATTAGSAVNATYATSAGSASTAGKASGLEHLYCHIITIDIPRYSTASTANGEMDTVRLIFHITSPNSTYSANQAYVFLETEVGKPVYCETIYIDTQSNHAEHYAGYVLKGEQATAGWDRIDLVAWDGSVELGGYYNSYLPSVTTVKIY